MNHPLDNVLERFDAMVARLQAHPRVRVLTWWVGPPASAAELDAVEAELGRALGPDVRALYSQANGLELLWDRPGDVDESGLEHAVQAGPVGWETFNQVGQTCLGAVGILPVRQVFLDADWHGHTYFDSMSDDEEMEFAGQTWGRLSFHRAIRIFDYYSSFNQAAFLLEPMRMPLRVTLGESHGGSWVNSRITDLTSYLELLLASHASVEVRRAALSALFGHIKPPLTHSFAEWQSRVPDLETILRGPA